MTESLLQSLREYHDYLENGKDIKKTPSKGDPDYNVLIAPMVPLQVNISQAVLRILDERHIDRNAYGIVSAPKQSGPSKGRESFSCNSSANLPDCSWISFNGRMSKCDICVVYLFPRWEDKDSRTIARRFCLTLNMSNRSYGQDISDDILEQRSLFIAKQCRQLLHDDMTGHDIPPVHSFISGDSFAGDYGPYTASNILAKEYEWNNMPTDEQLSADVISLITYYHQLQDYLGDDGFGKLAEESRLRYPGSGEHSTTPDALNDAGMEEEDPEDGEILPPDSSDPYLRAWNLCCFGAPGTGKSYRIKTLFDPSRHAPNTVNPFSADRLERVTFYADYMHAQFVGSYKPHMVNGDIAYAFRPGPFTRMLVNALNHPNQRYVLVIEELNRADAASVFGDLFQLLDRGKEGVSEYPIAVSEDLKDYLENQLTEDGKTQLSRLIAAVNQTTPASDHVCDRIVIPSNMYIWATMNSADQGVFPLDTAFKRRWDFEYVGIDDGQQRLADQEWNRQRRHINKLLLKSGVNEDKQLGPFFLGDPDLVRSDGNQRDRFDKAMMNKVIMYLFEDAARYRRDSVFDLTRIAQANGIRYTLTGQTVSLHMLFKGWERLGYALFKMDDEPADDGSEFNAEPLAADADGADTPSDMPAPAEYDADFPIRTDDHVEDDVL
ncbi:AAA family ATPase [Bifidobacterium biavatii]|uniref:ATPase n=1 Tax=Bifidobacterium biavatii DSM 23969 TaxID=1437608 RepID=A0A087A1T6_9BIFI|nr:AAA family ATPase [Bifidobacterium biavatii]KFI52736.1 ATPase [Bifidobacterium biavatii DSM 23969]